MRKFLRPALGALAALTISTAAIAADKAIIVLDASGSMWGQIQGRPKLEIAREALKTVLQSVPDSLELGLMAYGHREKGNCSDIELIVPPGPGTAAAIGAAADKMKFLGSTPLSAAVRQAAEALKYGEEKATVILITDGIETCNADPCALASELEQNGIDFTAHVVGFGLSEDEGKQVACLADNTGGKYLAAEDADELEDALTEVVVAEPQPQPEPKPQPEPVAEFNIIPSTALSETRPVQTGDGDVVYVVYKINPDGSRGEYVSTDYNDWKGNLEPGDYIITSRIDHAEVEQKVTIEAGKVAKPHYVLNAGKLILRPRPSEGGDIADGAAVNIKYPGDGDTTYYGQMKAIFPEGNLNVNVKLGAAEVTEVIPLKAGETVEKDIVVGVGRAAVTASYVPGMNVEDDGMFIEILKAKKAIDGSREGVTYAYSATPEFDLPAGDFVARAKIGEAVAEAPFSVKVAERVEVNVLLNAGVLFISAPGANFIEVFGAKKDIQGNRQGFGYAYNTEHQTTLPAGDYAVVVTRGEAKTETPVKVTAGERTEIAVP
ncbi:MAG: VWA domain-containing protein [Rhizobiaceae bacterium]|nr:VWA domain-containing protein [Rhizobiaceae bacterium]